ncbi:regulator of RNase E activity RraA [Neorhizobium sp. R1-B]|uniref:RraA family protein n=1 Tax=Neorhizobium sp. R1-B TaxID=2485162 RepID=UPI000DDA5124|nr:ribonuclease activity regulator RraA [Neorhizobium sp. R1-B]TDX83727.1 regulator of RNase E activity RraA [Neorhizobium sp. R1-B]
MLENRPAPLDDDTREKLRTVTTATLTTLLLKRGFDNTFMIGVKPVMTGKRRMVGQAFTMRYIPYRPDLGNVFQRDNRKDLQRIAVETVPPGDVLVIDSRGNAEAASCGEILMMRMMVRGVEGVVTDGGYRDSPSIGELDIPTFHQTPSAPPIMVKHHPADIGCPIACGGIAVFPGDIIVGDDEGVVAIPAGVAAEIAEEAVAKEAVEEYIAQCVLAGEPIVDIYPPTPLVHTRFTAWIAAGKPALPPFSIEN